MPVLVSIARAAGTRIMQVYDRSPGDGASTRPTAKSDGSPLTEADTSSHDCIVAALTERFPHIPVISEEDDDAAARARPLGAAAWWLVDPLDGTKEFVKRSGEFTVNIAYVEAGVPLAGVVLAPVTGMVWSGYAQEARRDGPDGATAISIRPCPAGVPGRIVASRDHAGAAVRALLEALPQAETVSVGSSLKFCLVADGRADLYFRDGPTMAWDTAAAHAVLRAAGGEVYGLEGTPLTYPMSRLRNPPFVAVGDRSLAWRHWLPPHPAP